jgi:hypothetical protein
MRRFAWAVLAAGLGLCMAGAGGGHGQTPPPPSAPPVELRQNYPNPFNPATTIPFALSKDLWANGHRPTVSLKIYNVLAQLVATPTLQGAGVELNAIELAWCSTPVAGICGYNAYWDGKVANGAEAASGVYIYQLIVDGRRFTKKMIVMK